MAPSSKEHYTIDRPDRQASPRVQFHPDVYHQLPRMESYERQRAASDPDKQRYQTNSREYPYAQRTDRYRPRHADTFSTAATHGSVYPSTSRSQTYNQGGATDFASCSAGSPPSQHERRRSSDVYSHAATYGGSTRGIVSQQPSSSRAIAQQPANQSPSLAQLFKKEAYCPR